jgi:hypothetical protein
MTCWYCKGDFGQFLGQLLQRHILFAQNAQHRESGPLRYAQALGEIDDLICQWHDSTGGCGFGELLDLLRCQPIANRYGAAGRDRGALGTGGLDPTAQHCRLG